MQIMKFLLPFRYDVNYCQNHSLEIGNVLEEVCLSIYHLNYVWKLLWTRSNFLNQRFFKNVLLNSLEKSCGNSFCDFSRNYSRDFLSVPHPLNLPKIVSAFSQGMFRRIYQKFALGNPLALFPTTITGFLPGLLLPISLFVTLGARMEI